MEITKEELSSMIDHTLLKPEAKEEEIKKLCDEAAKYNFHSVCVNPSYVGLAGEVLKDTSVKVCTVIGFPLPKRRRRGRPYPAEPMSWIW